MLEMGTVQVISFVGLSFAGGLFGLALKRMQKDLIRALSLAEGYVKLFAVIAKESTRTMGRLEEIETRLRIPVKKGNN